MSEEEEQTHQDSPQKSPEKEISELGSKNNSPITSEVS